MTPDDARGAARAWFPEPLAVAPLGEGHINDTWLVETAGRGRFVLQRLSERVFPDPRAIVDKVAGVVAHLRRRDLVRVPELIPADGRFWHEDTAGGIWRLCEFVGGTRSLHALSSVAEGHAAGAAFGRFQLALADLPGPVPDPLPSFMQLPHYLAELDATLARAEPQAGIDETLAVIDARRDLAGLFRHRDRLIHGDCKIDNLLFRAGGADVVCVIDLDTVMHGSWGWDFGDLTRSAAADGAEVNVARFAAIAAGFVGSGALDPAPAAAAGAERVDALVLAARYVALMLGVRFLTDHLRGDRYFKVWAAGENLERARTQLALLEDLERRERDLRDALRRL